MLFRDCLASYRYLDVNLAVFGHDQRLLCRHELLRLQSAGVRSFGVRSVGGQASWTCVATVLFTDRIIGGNLAKPVMVVDDGGALDIPAAR